VSAIGGTLFRRRRRGGRPWVTPELRAAQAQLRTVERHLSETEAANRELGRQAASARQELTAALADLAAARHQSDLLVAYARSRGIAALPPDLRALLDAGRDD